MDKVEEKIFEAIKSGQAKMRPRWYFILQALLMATTGVVLFLFIIFFVSLVAFALQVSGAWSAPNFGLPGWYLFIQSLPLILILLLVLFTFATTVLARRYPFAYQRPVFYLLLVIGGLALMCGLLAVPMAMHRALLDYAARNHIPFVNGFYEFEGRTPLGIHQGQIVVFLDNGLILRSLSGQTTTVIFTPTTSFGRFEPGDFIVVFGGSDANGTIHAFGIQRTAFGMK